MFIMKHNQTEKFFRSKKGENQPLVCEHPGNFLGRTNERTDTNMLTKAQLLSR